MTAAALYLAATLATWAGLAAVSLGFCRLLTLAVVGVAARAASILSLVRCALVAGICFLLADGLYRSPGLFSIPVVWPILSFWEWGTVVCGLGLIHSLADVAIAGRQRRATAGGGWLFGVALSFAASQIAGDKPALARGQIDFSPWSLSALLLLAGLAIFAMANARHAFRAQRIAKALLTHITLLVGSVIFGIPLLWLLLTSFKEDRDMASATGLVWVPRVQDTVATFDSVPVLYASEYNGRAVKGVMMARLPAGQVRLEVVDPAGLQGLALDRQATSLRPVPTEAPVVSGIFEGKRVVGFVRQRFDDGRQEVRIQAPPALAGRAFTAEPTALTPRRHVGLRLQNYSDALGYLPPEADGGLTYLKNSLIIVVMSVVGALLSSSLVAYAFSRLRFPGRDVLFGILLSTMMLPSAVTLLPKFLIFRQLGWIDTLLPLWVPAFFGSAFSIFLLRQFFKGIPMELEDASKIDGCSYLRSYWSVMLPQIKPALAVVAIWTFIGAWNDFMGPLVYINSPEKMPVSYAVQVFSSDHGTLPGYTMAMATLAIVPVVLLFFVAQRYFVEGVTLSGLGGK